jgi:two-component system, LytTR family, sensor kinase
MKRLIILLLVLINSYTFLCAESNSNLNKLTDDQIESRFLRSGTPIRYYSNILIQLQGNPTKEDSVIFKELVDTLNILIDKWDVYLIPKGTSNLIVEINMPDRMNEINKIIGHRDNSYQIVKKTVVLNMPTGLDFITRKKMIYYYVFRAMVVLNGEQQKAIPIAGSIFTEADPVQINFLPIDFEIIKELYSSKYEGHFNSSGNSERWNLSISIVLINIFAILLPLMLLVIIYQKGLLKKHHYDFVIFFKQGFLALIGFFIYYGIKVILSVLLFSKFYGVVTPEILIILVLILTGFISLIFIYLIERFLLKGKENFILEIAVPLLATMIVPVLVTFLLLYIFERIGANYDSLNNISLIITTVFSFTSSMGVARAFYIFTSVKSENIIRKKDVELAQMSELHKQAELQSLRAKINPHFLYNALNSIASLATTDARKTEQMALALSDFFKYAINREQKQLNTLSEELSAIRTYLEIEKVRFGDRLNFEIDCPEELLNIQIPQLLIQPLVENAIKHGLSQITEYGLIRILVSRAENQLKIRVYDNGPAFPDGPLSGFGIQNTQERIALLYGAKATINWQNGVEKYVEISIPV